MPSKKQFRILRKMGFKSSLIKRMSPAQINNFSSMALRKPEPSGPAGWITPDLEDHSVGEVGQHYNWAVKHFDLGAGAADAIAYGMSFDAGYVRYRVTGGFLDVEGPKDNVAKTSDVWGKYAKNRKVMITHTDRYRSWQHTMAAQGQAAKEKQDDEKWLDMIRKKGEYAGPKKTDESIQLNELRDYLGLDNEYGGWITPDKEVHTVDHAGHKNWILENLDVGDDVDWDDDEELYLEAYNAGCVRYVVTYFKGVLEDLNLEGNLEDIKKVFYVWWPTAVKINHIYIEAVDTNLPGTYNFPRDKEKLLKNFKPGLKESQQLNELKEYLGLDREYGGWITKDKKVHAVKQYAHTNWVEDNYNSSDYEKAFDDGCIRYQISYPKNELSIQGNRSALQNTFFIWWPTVAKADRIYMDIKDDKSYTIHGSTRKAELRAMFRKPKSKGHPMHKGNREPVIAPQGGKWWHADKGKPNRYNPNESIQINELKEYLRQEEEYGGWIAPDKKVHVVKFQGHTEWLANNFEGKYGSYQVAWENNLVRYQTEKTALGIEGKIDDIRKVFYIWWPTAIAMGYLNIEIVNSDTNWRYEESRSFDMSNSEKRVEARQWLKPRRTKVVKEDGFGQDKKRDRSLGAGYTVSIYKHDANIVEGEWNENVEKIKEVKCGMSHQGALKLQRKIIDEIQSRNSHTDIGWTDYFTRVEEDINETEGGTVGFMFRGGYYAGMKSTAKNTKKRKKFSPLGNNQMNEKYNTNSTWLKVGKNIVEVLLNKVTRRIKRGDQINEEEIATYKIFVDGVDVGYVDNIDNVFLVKNDKTFDRFDNLEEAIAEVMGPAYYDGKGTTEFVEFNPDPYSMNI